MAEKQEKNKFSHKIRGCFSGLTSLILALLLMAVIYVAAVLLDSPEKSQQNAWVVEEDEKAVTPLQAASTSDVRALSQMLGAPLPALPNHTPVGEARNTAHDGKNVRQVTLSYGGLIITAVRPASAAPLLLRNELSIQSRSDLTVMNLPATLASQHDRHCLYFASEFAAYSIYTPSATEEEFLSIIRQITQVR